ncbi:MAG: outer membrane beta-barrel protein [Candidatus Solibacter usitatus]|nr:outer membrane beta-barrel protein [Candidatus Solibacter usitatus]
MKSFAICFSAALSLAASVCPAQKWEAGGVTGGGFSSNFTVSNPTGSASTGFSPGVAVGGIIGQNLYRQIGGEIRYTFQFSNLQLSGGDDRVSFRGQTHTVQYNVLWHARSVRSRLRPFVGVGGGMRAFRGTGEESAYQPLSGFALLTKTQEWKLMAAAGGGIKYRLTPRLSLRAELWDYATPFPSRVIAASPGAQVGGWLHDIVPMVGLTFVY